MSRLRQFLTVLLLVNWVTCIVHCQSERVRWPGTAAKSSFCGFQAASHANSGEDCKICEWVATGGCKASDSRVTVPDSLSFLISVFPVVGQDEEKLSSKQAHLAAWRSPPPDPEATFLFVCRTALPARAPTLAL